MSTSGTSTPRSDRSSLTRFAWLAIATAIGAAGSLPVAAILGFNPSAGQYSGTALIFVYIALPVAIKIAAALLIWFIRIEAERGSVRDELMGRT